MKDERKILTRDIIYQKLLIDAKRTIGMRVLIFILSTLFFGMLYLIALRSGVLAAIIVTGAFFAFETVSCIFIVVRALLRTIKARRGEFSIIDDSVIEVEDNKLSIYQLLSNVWLHGIFGFFPKSNYYHIFKFESGKKFVANREEYRNTHIDTIAQVSLPGDHFFTVFYNDAPEKIILFYSDKIYNYKA